jgi:hypothetical protein
MENISTRWFFISYNGTNVAAYNHLQLEATLLHNSYHDPVKPITIANKLQYRYKTPKKIHNKNSSN